MSVRPLRLSAREHDLGDGFSVRRLLPQLAARHVGPFVFFDHMGPVDFAAGRGVDVRPHPHIGLATVTWLFAGSLRHRDSLGSVQDIVPGEVNWMTAGHGIVHSERTPPDARAAGGPLHGIQTWVALPQRDEDAAPGFCHVAAEAVPRIEREGVAMALIAGSAYGAEARVPVYAPTFYLEARLDAGARLAWPAEHPERGVYVVEGELDWDGESLQALDMAVQFGGDAAPLTARSPARVMLFGGAPLDGERRLWWNFVASNRERIDAAAGDWQAQRHARFPLVPGDEDERIPLPER